MITVEDMRDQLKTLDEVRESLASTEPLNATTFALNEGKVKFTLPPGWNVGLKDTPGTTDTQAHVRIGDLELTMTKDAALEATSLIGLTKQYVTKTPGSLIEPHLNYWYGMQEDRELKVLHSGGKALAFTKASIEPFSNVRLLDEALAAIEAKYGAGEVLADYKFRHDLRGTAVRLILPQTQRIIHSARHGGKDEDAWSVGLSLSNSLVGETPLTLQGYAFAWVCTNGAVSTHSGSGKYNRKKQGQGDEVYEWARASVDEILGGLEHELDAIESLTTVPLEGELNEVLADVFTSYHVPMDARQSIISALVESDDLTAYGVMQAITQSANAEDISDPVRQTLMEIGGDIPRAMSSRCSSCHRIVV